MPTHHELETDILIAGGGPAGTPCAIAAARLGARVVLCQDRPVLGGNASSEVRMHVVGADGPRGEEMATEAREGGIIEEIRLDTSVRNPQRCHPMFDLILYEKCRAEPKLTLLLNTAVVGVEKEGDRITHAIAHRQSTEDAFRIAARVFIDCTGDGRLGAEAGASFRHGREANSEYGETVGVDEADAKTLGSTLLFTARKHDHPVPFIPPPWARRFTEEDLKLRGHARAGVDQGLEYGYWWCEWGGQLDTIKDNEQIRDELLAIMLGVWDHIKNGHRDGYAEDHGADNWALDWFGWLPGKRESRRFLGQHVLSESDLLESVPQPDAIAYGGWPIDQHPPEGIDRSDERPNINTAVPHVYDIPLRSCVSRDVPNLMFAGRNISATHVAFASTRVMATCAVMGQGVGTAAAYALQHGRELQSLGEDAGAMQIIQQRLLRDDAYLIGRLNEDPLDRAREAAVTAASEQPQGAATNILTGQTRAIHGSKGAPPGRSAPGTHRWMSDPTDGLPTWIELRWKEPIRPAEVQIIFDTGMHRKLTLSHSDAYLERMCWGAPQPETVRDFAVQALVGGERKTLVEVEGNWQRRCIQRLENCPPTQALRLEVRATNGIDHARVFEVRVYDQEGAGRRWTA